MQLLQERVAKWYQSSWMCSLADLFFLDRGNRGNRGRLLTLLHISSGTYLECFSEHCAGTCVYIYIYNVCNAILYIYTYTHMDVRVCAKKCIGR